MPFIYKCSLNGIVGYYELMSIYIIGGRTLWHILELRPRKFWNQGITTEACRVVLAFSFIKIGITKIHTHHHVDNPASGKVMQKSGMHYLETKYKEIPDCAQISGDYCFYEITLEDWIRTE